MLILNDFQTTVKKALAEIDPNYDKLPGLVICGTHSPKNVEHLINKIQEAREQEIPTLLICFGHQLGAIEYARNVLEIEDATSEEFFDWSGYDDATHGLPYFAVRKRPELKVGLHEGETWWSNFDVAIDWEIPEHFVSVPFHPEYQSSKDNPHPLLVKFINKCYEVAN